jgi:hypothetical protein
MDCNQDDNYPHQASALICSPSVSPQIIVFLRSWLAEQRATNSLSEKRARPTSGTWPGYKQLAK